MAFAPTSETWAKINDPPQAIIEKKEQLKRRSRRHRLLHQPGPLKQEYLPRRLRKQKCHSPSVSWHKLKPTRNSRISRCFRSGKEHRYTSFSHR
jgi:hypothetical protein